MHKLARIVSDYICETQGIRPSEEISNEAMKLFQSLPGSNERMMLVVLVDLVLRCIQIVKQSWDCQYEGVVKVEPEVKKLACVLAERIYHHDTPYQ